MSTHIGVDIGPVDTHVVVHWRSGDDGGDRLAVFRFATEAAQLASRLDAAAVDGGSGWDDVALLACSASTAEHAQAMQDALRHTAFRGRLRFLQPDGSLAAAPWADPRSSAIAGMLAACVLSRLIGERTVLAIDVGATVMFAALIHEEQLPRAGADVMLEQPGQPALEDLRRLCEREGRTAHDHTLLVFGDGASAAVVGLALGLGCARAIVPMLASAFPAWGLLTGRPWLPIQSPIGGDDAARTPPAGGVIDARSLRPGATFAGPLELQDTTRSLQLPANTTMTVDSYGNLVIEFAGKGAP